MKAEDLMSLAEFTELTGLTPSTVYKNKSEGRFPFRIIRLGNRLKFPRAKVCKWINKGGAYLPPRDESKA